MKRSFAPMLVLVCGLLVVAASQRASDTGPVWAMAGLAFLVLAIAGRAGSSHHLLGVAVLLAFVLRWTTAAFDDWLSLFPKADQNGYFLEASWTAEAWEDGRGAKRAWYTAVGAYVHFLGAFFYAFGPSMMLARTISAVLGAIAVLLVHRVATHLFDARVGVTATLLYAIFPSYVYFQSDILRDPIVHVVILSLMALLTSRFPWRALIIVPPLVAALFLFRMPTALVILVPIVVLVYARAALRDVLPGFSSTFHGAPMPHRRRPRMRNLIVVVAFAGALLIAFDPVYLDFLNDVDALSEYRDEWATGGSAYLVDRDFDHLYEVVLFSPVSAFFFLFTPLPWHLDTPLTWVAFFENLFFFYPIAYLSLRAMNHESRHPVALGLILYLVIGAMLFGIVEGNIGTALRHRAQFTWVFVVFAAPAVLRLYESLALRIPALGRFDHSLRRPSFNRLPSENT